MSITYDDPGAKAVYKGILSQAGIADPTVVELVNSLGAIVWTGTGGAYNGALTGAFPANRTFFYAVSIPSTGGLGSPLTGWLARQSNDNITLYIVDSTGAPIEIADCCFEIHVYPS